MGEGGGGVEGDEGCGGLLQAGDGHADELAGVLAEDGAAAVTARVEGGVGLEPASAGAAAQDGAGPALGLALGIRAGGIQPDALARLGQAARVGLEEGAMAGGGEGPEGVIAGEVFGLEGLADLELADDGRGEGAIWGEKLAREAGGEGLGGVGGADPGAAAVWARAYCATQASPASRMATCTSGGSLSKRCLLMAMPPANCGPTLMRVT